MSQEEIHNLNFGIHGEPVEHLNIIGPECCGWLEVSNLGFSILDVIKSELKNLSQGKSLIVPYNDWSEVEDKPTQFTMFLILTNEQEKIWGDFLLSLGWEKVISFLNPNSGNVCNQYIFIPKELQVVTDVV